MLPEVIRGLWQRRKYARSWMSCWSNKERKIEKKSVISGREENARAAERSLLSAARAFSSLL